jgi:hypothetical protein
MYQSLLAFQPFICGEARLSAVKYSIYDGGVICSCQTEQTVPQSSTSAMAAIPWVPFLMWRGGIAEVS